VGKGRGDMVEGEKGSAVVSGAGASDGVSMCVSVGEVGPCEEAPPPKALKGASGVAAGGDAPTDGFLQYGLRPSTLESQGEVCVVK